MIVAVGSTNPTKIQAVSDTFRKYFENIEVTGVQVSSGVAEQPKSEDEMFRGALNRAKAALRKVKSATYGVGIEGGIHTYSYGCFERSLVVIVNKKGEIGIGASGGLVLPSRMLQKIHKEGKNIEQATDELFGTKEIGEGVGMFGMMTKNIVTRAEATTHGVAFALARFLHEDLYGE